MLTLLPCNSNGPHLIGIIPFRSKGLSCLILRELKKEKRIVVHDDGGTIGFGGRLEGVCARQ